MHGRIFWGVILVLGMTAGISAAEEVLARKGDFHLTMEGTWMMGPVSGYLQIPTRSKLGTTSKQRPTLEELGIEIASIFDGEIRPGIGDHELYFGGQLLRMSEDATLDENLKHHGAFFPAGSAVTTHLQMDWYRAGYRYRIRRGDEVARGLPLEIHARVGMALLDYHSEIFSDAFRGGVDDEFIKGAPQGGVELEWHATKRFSIEGEMTSTFSMHEAPWILTAQVLGRFTLREHGRTQLKGYLGAGYQHISYHDEGEPVRKEINVDFGPMLMVGLELRV